MTKKNNPELYIQLIHTAKTSPSAVSYQALLARNAPDCARVVHALFSLEFEHPPVDLHAWYVHWFHYIKNDPADYNTRLPQDGLAWLLCTAGRAMGYAKSVLLADPGAMTTSDKTDMTAKSQRLGAAWIAGAKAWCGKNPYAIATMCGLMMWPDRTPGKITSTHNLWSGLSDEDLSARLLREIFGEHYTAVVEVVLDLHDAHWDRCDALRTAFEPTVAQTVTLPVFER